MLAKVTVARSTFPASAFERKLNPHGRVYYSVSFVVAIHFLTTLEFKVMVDGRVVGSAIADYL
jgi:hypothetical protein